MKQDIELYIQNKKVDFSDELTLPFTYQLKDINNPTVIKNPFTKTINIVGTPNNNKIFGEIYKMDREQMYNADVLTGAYFNPSIRTPFSIFKNSEIIESGYMQLNNISIKEHIINYNITLYGGIGNFFYNLMYNDNNEPLTLSNLVYGVEGASDSDSELDFTINKEFIMENWQRLNTDNLNTIFDYITFIPSYNGLPNNFDSDKVVEYDVNDNSYSLAELPQKMTEWEIKDLRSYLQRPAIKLEKVINACQNPVNNGGYTVKLDEDFFNDNNPYFKDSWIALPLLPILEVEKNNIVSSDFSICTQYVCQNNKIFQITDEQTTINDTLIPLNTTAFPLTSNGKGIDCSSWEKGTLTDIDINLNLSFYTDTLTVCEVANFYTNAVSNNKKITSPMIVKFTITNKNNEIIAKKEYTLTSINAPTFLPNANFDFNFDFPKQYINGYFEYVGKENNKNKYIFVNDKGENIINLTLNNVPFNDELYVNFEVERELNDLNYFRGGTLYDTLGRRLDGYFYGDFQNSTIKKDAPDTNFATGSKITKKILLKTEKTPADYLLSYCKLFNLFFTVDETEKTVNIMTMNNYFNGNIIDITDKIDYSKEINIKPVIYDNKFYVLSYDDAENHYLNKYKTQYNVKYGQKRINTNYNFNSNTKQLFEGNVFQNTVSCVDTSSYYATFDNYGIAQPPFLINGCKYTAKYKNGTVTKRDDNATLPALPNITYWNRNGGYDCFAKNCFYTIDNGEKSLSDISSTLLFYNGKVHPKDLNGNDLNYYLSDDNDAMFILNDRVGCYFYDSTYTQTIPLNEGIPQFLRYKIFANNIASSFDFGKPKELFIPNTTYDDDTTLYNQFWKGYYEDTLDINTKEVTCYVNLNDMSVNGELLRNFYYFNGCYWLLNKIENYNCNSYDTTKCTFIKINNLDNYVG